MRQDYKNYSIEDFKGGISSERKRGPRGSFKFGQGLDIHGEDNVLKCNNKLEKNSGTVVTDLILTMFRASDGNMYAFGDTGKIYRKAGTTWALAHTETDGKITGAVEFEAKVGAVYTKNLYWATQTKVKRIQLSLTGAVWSPTEIGTLKVGTSGHYHSMRIGAGVVMICDGDHLALIDREEAFNTEALRIPSGTISKALLDRNDNIIIGAEDDLEDGWIITWDRFADSWITKSETQAGGVNAMRYLEGGVMAQTGINGILRFWNFSDVHPLRNIPGTTSAYPGAVTEYNGKVLIGMSGTKGGVYSIGRNDKNDPLSINLDYIPSHGKLTGEIGAIAKDGNDLYVSWKDSTTYGIDKISTNKATGIYEGLEFDGGMPETAKKFGVMKIVTRAIPTGCTITPQARTNRDTGWTALKRSDGLENMIAGETVGIFNLENKGESYEVRLTLAPSGTSTPEVLSINNYFVANDIL